MMSSVETEQVLVVPPAVLHEIGYFQAFTSDVKVYRDRLPTLLLPVIVLAAKWKKIRTINS